MPTIHITTPRLRPVPRSVRARQLGRHKREFLHIVRIASRREWGVAIRKGLAVLLPGGVVEIGEGVVHWELVDGGEGLVFGGGAGGGDGGRGVGD